MGIKRTRAQAEKEGLSNPIKRILRTQIGYYHYSIQSPWLVGLCMLNHDDDQRPFPDEKSGKEEDGKPILNL